MRLQGAQGPKSRRPTKRTQGKKPHEHGIGPPSIHKFEALVRGLLKHSALDGKVRSRLKQAWASLPPDLKGVCLRVRYCRTSVCYDKMHIRLQYHVKEPLETIVAEALTAAGGSLRSGPAPSGGLEEQVSLMLGPRKKTNQVKLQLANWLLTPPG